MLGKIQFGQKLKKTFLKTDQGFVLIENANSSSLPECSTANQLNQEAINKSENVAPHEMSSMNCDTTDIAVHEEKMLMEGPEIQEINNSGKWCSICSYVFQKQSDLDEHIARVHGVNGPETYEYSQLHSENSKIVFPCCICFKVFPTKNDRKEHSLSSHGTQILEHQETSTDSNSSENKENLFFSTVYGENTANIQETHEKFNIAIENSLSCFPCHICSKVFTRKSDVNRHVLSIHEGKKPLKQYPCHICSKVFQKKSDFKRHVLSDHEGKKLLKCDSCDKCFSTKYHLNKHVKQVHEERKREQNHDSSQFFPSYIKTNIQCRTCSELFPTQQNLKDHFASAHIDICQNIMKERKIGLPKIEKETKWKCPLPFEFNISKGYEENVLNIEKKTLEVVQPSQNTVEMLDHDPSFQSKYDVDQELSPNKCEENISRVHGKGKFKCLICFKVLVAKSTLKRHISLVHQKNKPFQCISCPTRFGFKYELENHFKKIHD